jgi:hypothetical protein
MALNFYAENATGFVKDFGMMPMLMERLSIPQEWRRVFLAKLSAIHAMAMKMSEEEARKGK